MVIMMQVDYDRGFDRCHPDADRIFRVEGSYKGEWVTGLARPFAEQLAASSPHVRAGAIVCRFFNNELVFSPEGAGESSFYQEKALPVSASFTDVFTFEMLEGDAQCLVAPENALIPQSLAQKLFGGEPALGKRLTGETSYTVGGVYRDFPRNSSVTNVIYTPLPEKENLNEWGIWNYECYLRVDAPEQAAALLVNYRKGIRLADLMGARGLSEDDMQFRVSALPELHYIPNVSFDATPKSDRQRQLILGLIALVIVLIGGINFTNFSTALMPKRIRSINTQKVLGGADSTIRAALVLEAVGVAFASWLVAVELVHVARLTPVAALVEADVSLAAHPLLVASTAAIALLTGLLAGLYPAFYMTSFPPAMALKGSFGLSPGGRRLRNVLMSVQFIASFVLILCASFMFLQNHFMQHSPLGYDRDEVIVTNITEEMYKSKDALTGRLKDFAGIADVTFANDLMGGRDDYSRWGREYRDGQIMFEVIEVEASFLRVMGIEVSEGRDFLPGDAGKYIFNRKARDKFGLTLDDKIKDSEQIVGFMPDIKFASFRREIEPMAFFVLGSYDSWGNHAYIKVQAGADLRAAMTHVRSTVQGLGEHPFMFNVRFYDEVLNGLYEKEQKLNALITLFSLVAILISIVGVFGLVVFDSEYRRKEIGIRRVFGSTTGEILVLFNKGYVRILAVCFVLAAPVAWYAVTRWLENFAYRTPMYWWVYAAAFAVVFVLTVATVTFQNWRAANMNPVESIKGN
jgi:putative ABC transport system permease protein